MTIKDYNIEDTLLENEDETLLEDGEIDFEDIEDGEIDFEDIEDEEKEEGIGHRVITMDPSLDGEDNFFDEAYFEN